MTTIIASKSNSEYSIKMNKHTDADVCHVISTLIQGLSCILENNKRVVIIDNIQSAGYVLLRWHTRNKRADEDFMYFLIMAKMLEKHSPESLKVISNLDYMFS